MENLLRKLGLGGSQNPDEILPLLEGKQLEYLERLDNVEDEKRRRQLEDELKEIEMAISSLSWVSKKEVSGIKKDDMGNSEDFAELKKKKADNPGMTLVAETEERMYERYLEAEKLLDAEEYAKGVELMQSLAEEGSAAAQYELGVLYDNGIGVEYDTKTAFSWYLKAAEQGYPEAQHNVGYFYESGQVVAADADLAVSWYEKAAEQGFAQSQCSLGVLYEFGTGVKKDIKLAISWYEKAAAQNFAKAWGRLGWIYAQNNMQDRANFCYQKGVNGDDPFAALQLAFRIMKGMLGTINYDKAIQLYELAGEGGIADAYFLLGELYNSKEGGRYDRNKAMYYYKLAADGGCESAYSKIH